MCAACHASQKERNYLQILGLSPPRHHLSGCDATHSVNLLQYSVNTIFLLICFFHLKTISLESLVTLVFSKDIPPEVRTTQCSRKSPIDVKKKLKSIFGYSASILSLTFYKNIKLSKIPKLSDYMLD